ncbi:ankyrin repeat-containing protein [Ceratocystis pirilliformis]|uniref:Ankyrin repeat-containing protein n=1 Tax=Ceratocystis pirilliformis TaxID=259994 RepID=A0ABR3YSD9_9PEZI
MAPTLNEEEIDDLLYFSRTGEDNDLNEVLASLAEREKLSKAEILIAAKDESKATCLHMATGNGHISTVKILLEAFSGRPAEEKNAYVDAANEFGNTGLHWAAMGGHLEAVQALLAANADPVLTNEKDYMPLDLANLHGKLDIVQFFMKEAGDLETGNDGGLEGATKSVTLETLEKAEESKETPANEGL